MKKYSAGFLLLIPILILFSGCSAVGTKTASLSIVYGITALLSLLLLAGYCSAVKNKEAWLLLLFASVFVVNIGYFTLSISHNIEEALLANRISYLGSVFLPMAMFMTILKTINIRYKKILPAALLLVGVFVLLVAVSPGYLDIYYKEVSFQIVNGVSVLSKVYGPWHCLYLFYLLGYFIAMISVITYAITKKKVNELFLAGTVLLAVFVNIGVWLLEQLVDINFEILSISYIISEMFLLVAFTVTREFSPEPKPAAISEEQSTPPEAPGSEAEPTEQLPEETVSDAQTDHFLMGLNELTKTERAIYDAYIAGMTTKEIMSNLNIKENTLKYHNKNLYGKLGVSSRKQLIEIYRQISDSES